MKSIFPVEVYDVDIESNSLDTWENLKSYTEITRSSFVFFSSKRFFGLVGDGQFILVSIIFLSGTFCSFKGDFNENHGQITVQIRKRHKLILKLWLIFPAFAMLISLLSGDILSSLIFIIFTSLFILFFYFILFKVLFKYIVKKGLDDLRQIIRITEMTKIDLDE